MIEAPNWDEIDSPDFERNLALYELDTLFRLFCPSYEGEKNVERSYGGTVLSRIRGKWLQQRRRRDAKSQA